MDESTLSAVEQELNRLLRLARFHDWTHSRLAAEIMRLLAGGVDAQPVTPDQIAEPQ